MNKYCYIVLLLEHKSNNLPFVLDQVWDPLRPIELTYHSNTRSCKLFVKRFARLSSNAILVITVLPL